MFRINCVRPPPSHRPLGSGSPPPGSAATRVAVDTVLRKARTALSLLAVGAAVQHLAQAAEIGAQGARYLILHLHAGYGSEAA